MTFVGDASNAGGEDLMRACLTLEEIAIQLGVSTRTVERLIAKRKLRKVPLEGRVRVTPAEFRRFLEGRPHAESPEPNINNIN